MEKKNSFGNSPGCAPIVLQKLVLCVLFLHGWQGSWEQQIQEFARRGKEANASPEARSEAPGRCSGARHQQHSKPQNKDSQHKLNQARGCFPGFSCNYLTLCAPTAFTIGDTKITYLSLFQTNCFRYFHVLFGCAKEKF